MLLFADMYGSAGHAKCLVEGTDKQPKYYVSEQQYVHLNNRDNINNVTFRFEIVIGLMVINFFLVLVTAQWPCLVKIQCYPKKLCSIIYYFVVVATMTLAGFIAYFRFSHGGRVCSGEYLHEIYGKDYLDNKSY